MAKQRTNRMHFSSDFLMLAGAGSGQATAVIPAIKLDLSFDGKKRGYYSVNIPFKQPKGSIESLSVGYRAPFAEEEVFLLYSGLITITDAYDYATTWLIYFYRDSDYIYLYVTVTQEADGYPYPNDTAPSVIIDFKADYFYPPNL